MGKRVKDEYIERESMLTDYAMSESQILSLFNTLPYRERSIIFGMAEKKNCQTKYPCQKKGLQNSVSKDCLRHTE
jgi:hypothetical protein